MAKDCIGSSYNLTKLKIKMPPEMEMDYKILTLLTLFTFYTIYIASTVHTVYTGYTVYIAPTAHTAYTV